MWVRHQLCTESLTNEPLMSNPHEQEDVWYKSFYYFRLLISVFDTTLCDKVCQRQVGGFLESLKG
jgi:hypothetical protein